MTGAINGEIKGIERKPEACPNPRSIAEMPPGFFWTRIDALGFPDDFARQIDDGTLPPAYHAVVRRRVDDAALSLSAAEVGRPA